MTDALSPAPIPGCRTAEPGSCSGREQASLRAAREARAIALELAFLHSETLEQWERRFCRERGIPYVPPPPPVMMG